MKSGFMFSLGFIIQRGILTTLGFLGLAAIYQTYDLNGPVYLLVGLVMLVAGSYVLKGRYLHLPFDALLGRKHKLAQSNNPPSQKTELKPIPLKMAVVQGFIAGFGFGAYATILVFTLAPQVPSAIYAPLPGFAFGIGTMCMQIILGAVFANIMRLKHLTVNQIKYIGRLTAGRALYYGGIAFAVIGVLIAIFPVIDSAAIKTGIPIPNLDAVGVSTGLVIIVVGVIGLGSIYQAFRQITREKQTAEHKNNHSLKHISFD